ncbi:MAG: coproporphyrinogen III oxidase, partial [Proteobacteria bacterium]|nr:coproporphyrinogen III oxidase [Pseudomonadota bacterium]
MNLNFEEKKIAAENWFKNLRNSICAEFEKIEYLKSKKKKIFKKNNWKAGGNSKGGGTFALIENGSVFEKVGVNISTISGKFHKQFRRKIPGALNNPNFWASGISVVAHMKNPKVPAFHFNTRFIVTSKSWFGGGMDMTPSIEDLKQKKYFHQEIKKMCNLHDKNYYSQHKKNCDQYFYLPHRNEPRGDGGIFYDYLNSKNWNKDFNYTKDVGITFLKISSRIIQKKM